ncbi:membrane-bound transcription factor site-2 protease [Fopius arisanus]|uniref:Membrane-bound transcription factor site-2 protease n=1 Tax=Fopius arisanus TaxID=64838 RepID=A0A9R1SUB5_9HYME|nr:PREDICTED: membrane-bound transcription factor site-2 protease [Fopius arisanus]
MNPINFLAAAGIIHGVLLFFNMLFRSCSHIPYLLFMENTGLEVKTLSIKWFTGAFNRPLVKWGTSRSKFWILWFNLGVVVTIVLLPVVSVILIKMLVVMFLSGPKGERPAAEWELEPMIPGVNVPFADIQYYAITLGLCSIVHEAGHALAAAREDVQLYGVGMLLVYIVPVAFVSLNSEQLSQRPMQNQLRILCAGVWHNIVLAVVAAVGVFISPWLWAPMFSVNSGVVITAIQPHSPLLGITGLSHYDVIHRINDCSVRNSNDWHDCILQSVRQSTPGYCVPQALVQEHDESIPVWTMPSGEINCCRKDSETDGKLCFEFIEEGQVPLQLQEHSCLPARLIIEKSRGFCSSGQYCPETGTNCMKPTLDNVTKVVQIKREIGRDVLFFGYPADIYRTIEISEWVPKYQFLSSEMPESLALLCKYITVISAGLAVMNVVPCFFFDGQHIVSTLAQNFLRPRIRHKSLRQAIALTITSVGSLVLVINIIHAFVQRQR